MTATEGTTVKNIPPPKVSVFRRVASGCILALAGLWKWCIVAPLAGLWNKCRQLYGFDLDSMAFNEKDGYSPFNALATFALAQGAALTAVAKGEGRDKVVLGLYAFTVTLTTAWIVVMLRAKQKDAAGAVPGVRAYDRPSIRYGRFTLSWTLVLGVVLFGLGWAELLPNQTVRVAYNKGAIQCEPYTYQERLNRAGGNEAFLDEWVGWIGRGTRAAVGEQFIWLEQKTPFPESYKPFALDLTCNKSYLFGRPVAFLIKQPSGGYRPTYRQIQFRDPGVSESYKATLDVEDAARDEYIVILLFARDPKHVDNPPAKEQFHFQLVPHFAGEG